MRVTHCKVLFIFPVLYSITCISDTGSGTDGGGHEDNGEKPYAVRFTALAFVCVLCYNKVIPTMAF